MLRKTPGLSRKNRLSADGFDELNKPYLGLCLGHQLLADALGGTCGPQTPPEIGVLEVNLNDAGKGGSDFCQHALNAEVPAMAFCLRGPTPGKHDGVGVV